ncbi:MAG TPA: 1-deoxy-D-xylulose-5-phosphate reductoisomerase, partial [Candidatus Angelobacter sp.]|nr:1-deoxy-D-xylulose-5-phosphate reductoisomerase [Candidatus Angelobacter sp.]
MKQLAILGSTGSIGRQCLSVVDALKPRFGVVALAAGGNLEELVGQIERYQPELV